VTTVADDQVCNPEPFDAPWHEALAATLEEWDSSEDDEAFRDFMSGVVQWNNPALEKILAPPGIFSLPHSLNSTIVAPAPPSCCGAW
jgi:hypothetical protein